MKTVTEILKGATVSDYQLVTPSGRHIRMATQVNLADGRRVRFVDKVSKREAFANVQYQIERGNLDRIVEEVKS